MKSLLALTLVAALLVSCEYETTTTETPKEVQEEVKPEPMKLAWGESHADWDLWLTEAVLEKQWPSNIKSPCKKLALPQCVIQLSSIMAKYESGFDPAAKYEECSTDKNKYKDAKYVPEKKKYCMMSGGEIVTSRGLFQISKDSANSSRYNCNITDSKQLHDPKTNIRCHVNILHYQAMKGQTLMGEPKLGCAAYHSVCRASSGSYAKILSYLKSF